MRNDWLVCKTSGSIMETTDNKEIADEDPFKHLFE